MLKNLSGKRRMTDIFYDRYGRKRYADDIVPAEKYGYFAVLIKDARVLLTYPLGKKAPEFPGGSLVRGENFRDCLFRKLYEETGIEFMLDKSEQCFEQVIPYFADDEKPYGTFYIYHQTFFVYDADKYGFDVERERWKTPENSLAVWVSFQDIVSGKVKINYAHWQAFKQLFGYSDDNDAL